MAAVYNSGAGLANTFFPDMAAGHAVIPNDAIAHQLGPSLSCSSSVVVFARDSFTMVGKRDNNNAVIADQAGAITYMAGPPTGRPSTLNRTPRRISWFVVIKRR